MASMKEMMEQHGLSIEEFAKRTGLQRWEIEREEEIGLPFDSRRRAGEAYIANRLLPALHRGVGVDEVSAQDAPWEPNVGDLLLRSYTLSDEQREALYELEDEIHLRICLADGAWGFYLTEPPDEPGPEWVARYMYAWSARASLNGQVVRWNEDSPEDLHIKEWARKAIKQHKCQPEPLDYAIDLFALQAADLELLQDLCDLSDEIDLRVVEGPNRCQVLLNQPPGPSPVG